MKDAFKAGLIGALVGGAISATIGFLAPLPPDSLVNAVANGAAGFFSGFFGGFMALVVQGLARKRTRVAS
jgi:hypothetical protein